MGRVVVCCGQELFGAEISGVCMARDGDAGKLELSVSGEQVEHVWITSGV